MEGVEVTGGAGLGQQAARKHTHLVEAAADAGDLGFEAALTAALLRAQGPQRSDLAQLRQLDVEGAQLAVDELERVVQGCEGVAIRLGDDYELELDGPVGSRFQVLFNRDGLGTPVSTVYGDLELLTQGIARVAFPVIPASGRTTLTFPMDTDPALVGATFGFQALGRSAAAPANGAFTNSIVLTVVP